MSQVHYKFKSSKDYDSATFDGHSISVFDLKKEILIAKGLKGPDDLALTHAESGEEYYDDATLIPRNTSILVARVPAKPGRGGAQRYLEGSGPIPRGGGMTRNVFERPGQSSQQDPMGGSVKVYKNTTSLLTEDGPPAPAVDTSHMTEEERTKFVFEQAASYWDKTQEGMASAPYRPLGKFQGATRNPPIGGQKPGGAPAAPGGVAHTGPYQRQPMEQQQRPPPNTYVCYRCGKKGEHWIQFCPTNNDKSFEPIGIKKTTGIPRSFLKTVESDTLQSKKGVMVTQDGNLVIATTNDYEWKKFHEKSKGTLTSEEAYSTAPVPDDMRCPICHLLLKSAVQAPCCGTNFCDECIRTYLVHPPKGEDPFKCQSCSKHLVPDQLIPNAELRQRVEQHLRDWAKNRRGASDGNGAAATAAINSRGGTPNPEAEGTGPRSGAAAGTFQAQIGSTLSGDRNTEEDRKTEAGHKRKLSSDNGNGNIDHQGAAIEGEHSRDHASWKNKKHHATNNNGNFNAQNFNRSRPPMHGPGTVGPMDPSMMFPEALPPGFFELMQQHDPGLFMDPAFMGSNSVPPFMMPGFMPPFGPEIGGMQGVRGPGGSDMWGMGRGLPGLPPMGPGHPTPRIGFSDGVAPGAGAGRGRSRGGWQDSGNSGNVSGPGLMHSIDRSSQDAPQVANQAGDNVKHMGDSQVSGTTGDVAYNSSSPARARTSSRGRFEDDDDDIDMSQVPTGPRASRRLSIEDDEDIPKGPRAGPDADYDRTSNSRRSESPPRAPLADRLRQRSASKARSDKDDKRSSSSHHQQHMERSHLHQRKTDQDKDGDQDRRGSESSAASSAARQKSIDPQREYEIRRQASFGGGARGQSDAAAAAEDQEEIISFKARSMPLQQSTDKSGRKGRLGYGGNDGADEKFSEAHHGQDNVERGGGGGAGEATDQRQNLAVTGLVSSSARERERRERERRGSYD
ncbi:E3 ubiquitin-protein ligase rbbp6 [Mortierella alpina]|uniref:E3 ubiquitin-protein ligase rbbp6 n=1 Tax=Mortierella alpina TaxID=64518 RepID=A0A9P6J4C7_MORAP|nr:E3 ubiquitin-protein ligase rbbp6 [Mortierella alpina]